MCQIQNEAASAVSDILRSFLARQSNLGEECASRPADYSPCANLDGEEIRSFSLPGPSTDLDTFPLGAHCYIQVCPPTPFPASCHFLSATGASASSFYVGCDGPVVCLCKNVSPGRLISLFAEVWAQKISLPLICDSARFFFGNCCF